jgi:hypothetical protein
MDPSPCIEEEEETKSQNNFFNSLRVTIHEYNVSLEISK